MDTNVLVSAHLAPSGHSAEIVRRFRHGGFDLVLSEPILAEFQEVMSYGRLRRHHHRSDEDLSAIVASFRKFATLVEPGERLSVVRDDPDDDTILEAAVAGGAEFVVSGDSHLLQVKSYRGIRVVTPATFMVIPQEGGVMDK